MRKYVQDAGKHSCQWTWGTKATIFAATTVKHGITGERNVRVSKVEPTGTADVYNMEVEDTHDFAVGNGIIAHNCYDAWRYGCMRFSITAPLPKPRPAKPYSPLDDDEPTDKYEFYRRF